RDGNIVAVFGEFTATRAAAGSTAAATHAHSAASAWTARTAATAAMFMVTTEAAPAHIAAGHSTAPARRAKAEGAAHAELQRDHAGASQVIARNQVGGRPRIRIGTEIAQRGLFRNQARTRGKRGTGVFQSVAVDVPPQIHVIARPRLEVHEW